MSRPPLGRTKLLKSFGSLRLGSSHSTLRKFLYLHREVKRRGTEASAIPEASRHSDSRGETAWTCVVVMPLLQ